MFGIYIHIPFCLKKCDYCDFFSVPCERNQLPVKEYSKGLFEQLGRDVDELGLSGRTVVSVYFGGGTPSLMPPAFFESILREIEKRFEVTVEPEISCEVNPKTAGAAWFKGARDAGITRVSVGVQSFHDELLCELGRIHTAEDAMQAIAQAQDAGFKSVGADLIFGIPAENNALLEDDVKTAMTFQPEHISAYQLTIEGGTPLAKRCEGRHPLADEDLLEQMRIVARMVTRSGWGRYEISNFAKPGLECRHNINYWRYGEYLGLGAGATSFLYGGKAFERRWTQVRDIAKYMKGTDELAESEDIDVRTAMAEYCFLGLRMMDGVVKGDFEKTFGAGFDSVFGGVALDLMDEGLLLESEGRIMLSAKGIELSNQVFERFLP